MTRAQVSRPQHRVVPFDISRLELGRQSVRIANLCAGGARLHPQGGATGGADMRFCEGILLCR